MASPAMKGESLVPTIQFDDDTRHGVPRTGQVLSMSPIPTFTEQLAGRIREAPCTTPVSVDTSGNDLGADANVLPFHRAEVDSDDKQVQGNMSLYRRGAHNRFHAITSATDDQDDSPTSSVESPHKYQVRFELITWCVSANCW